MASDALEQVKTSFLLGKALLSNQLQSYDPIKLVVGTAAATYLFCYLRNLQTSDKTIPERMRRSLFFYLRKLPFVKSKVEKELVKVKTTFRQALHDSDATGQSFITLPEHGMSKEEVIAAAKSYDTEIESPDSEDGRVSGAVFHSNLGEQEVLLKEVYGIYAYSNPLWPKLYPGCRKMEAEVVRMTCSLLRGGPDSCGTMSSGGSMSILLACLTYRNYAHERGVEFPEIVLPTSAHAAFHKAGELFRMKLVHIKVDPKTYKVDVKAMRRAISGRTAMLVGSAPNFPYGTTDDINAIAKLGLEFDVPVHVDACLGGFLLPFARMGGMDVPNFDFSVPGVTSISADSHKYGLTPKGSSIIAYSSRKYIHYQYYCWPDWQGGIYASSTIEGSRAGANIASCWATMLFFGRERYIKSSCAVVETVRKITEGVKKIPHLRTMGDCSTSIVSFTSDDIDIHRLHDLMQQKGWYLANLQFPSGVHIMVTLNQARPGVVDSLLSDLQSVVDEILSDPKQEPEGAAALYGMAQKLPDRSIVQEFAYTYLDTCYETTTAGENDHVGYQNGFAH